MHASTPFTARVAFSSLASAAVIAGAATAGGCRLDWTLPDAPPDAGLAGIDGGGGMREAGSEAGAALDCTGAFLCTTFDDGLLSPPFDQTFVTPGGALRVETTGASPHETNLYAFRPSVGATPSSAYAQSPLLKQKLTSASLAFDILPVRIEATTRVCVAGITFNDSAANEHVVRLLVGPGGTTLQDRTSATPVPVYDATTALPLQWTRVVLGVDIGGHATVTFDGAPVIDVMLSSIGSSSTATRAFVGINFVSPSTSNYELRFDNVRLDGH